MRWNPLSHEQLKGIFTSNLENMMAMTDVEGENGSL